MEIIVLTILGIIVNLFLIYWVIKNAIDNSINTQGLERIYETLLEIRDELKKQNTKE